MKLIENILYVEFWEWLDAGLAERTGRRQKNIKDPVDSRKVLIQYSTLKQKYKDKIHVKFGDVTEYAILNRFKHALNGCRAAYEMVDFWQEQFKNHELPNGTKIPMHYYDYMWGQRPLYLEMCIALFWLDGLTRNAVKDLGYTSKGALIDDFCKYARLDNLPFPKARNKVYAAIRRFREEGYKSVINRNLGNSNSRKVGTGEYAKYQEALLMELLKAHTNLNFSKVASLYNLEADKLNYPTITRDTVRNFYKKYAMYIDYSRTGESPVKIQQRRMKPSAAMLYITADAWDVELPYQETEIIRTGKNKGKTKTSYHKRLKLYVILDPFNNYPVGYSIADTENSTMTKAAYENAVKHVKSLTGGLYKFGEIQIDNFLSKELEFFFRASAKYYTPASVGNAKSKVVERYFKKLNEDYCQQHFNWSGFGLKSTNKNQPNQDVQEKLKVNYPTKEEVRSIIVQMIQTEREKKQKEWLESFNNLSEDKKFKMSRETYLMLYGIRKPETNKVHASVFSPTFNGTTIHYDSANVDFRELYKYNWTTLYDPEDFSTILITANSFRDKFLLKRKVLQPMTKLDRKEGDFERLKADFDQNKELHKSIDSKTTENFSVIEDVASVQGEHSNAIEAVAAGAIINSRRKDNNQKEAAAKGLKEEIKAQAKEEKKRAKNAFEERMAYLDTQDLPNLLDDDND